MSGNDKALSPAEMAKMVSDMLAAYVSNNKVDKDELPYLYERLAAQVTYLAETGKPFIHGKPPAVPVKQSIRPDYLVCLEDGRKFKMLKRHLETSHNMTPDEYREKWGLPADYPMQSDSHSKKRARIAVETGLGKSNAK